MKRSVYSATAIGAASIAAVLLAPSVAQATERPMERSGCYWNAVSVRQEARTERRAPNDCAGHGWVQAKSGGYWSAWDHSFSGGRISAPSIQQSRHKTCADCGYITLTP